MKRQVLLVILGGLAVAAFTSAQPGPPPPSRPSPTQPTPMTPEPTQTAMPAAAPEEDAWQRWVNEYYKVLKIRKGLEKRVDEQHAYPDPRVPTLMEIVGEDNEFVYLRNLPLEDPRSAGHTAWQARQARDLSDLRFQEFLNDKYILPRQELEVPPPFTHRIHLEEMSTGLPRRGLWQMGFDVGDFDGDGRLDLVLPPARKGEPHPWIVLNKLDGWRIWEDVKWPDIPFDYGDVKVADFDGDGNLDIAIANHFKKAYVMYGNGNGKGDFTRYVELPTANPVVTSRAIAVADFDGDGRPDIVQLAELDLDLGTNLVQGSGLVAVDLNTRSGWKLSPAAFPVNIYGDNVTVGDFNGDGSPDILIASHKANNEKYVFLNDGKGTRFTPYESNAFPWSSFVLGVAAGPLDGKRPDQAVLGVLQSVRGLGEKYSVHALLSYRLGRKSGKTLQTPQRGVIYRDQKPDVDQYRCVTAGDLDGDVRLDIVAGRASGEIQIFLQMPDGRFAVETRPGWQLGDAAPNHLMIRDLDGDGNPELIVNFSDGQKTPGSVRVWKVVRETATKPHAKAATK